MALSGVWSVLLIFANQFERGNALSRAMLQTSRDDAVLMPITIRKLDSQKTLYLVAGGGGSLLGEHDYGDQEGGAASYTMKGVNEP